MISIDDVRRDMARADHCLLGEYPDHLEAARGHLVDALAQLEILVAEKTLRELPRREGRAA